MNINSKAFAKPKLTKRQRKSKNRERLIQMTLRNGGKRIGNYIGRNPEYADINAGKSGSLPHWVKVCAGVPFVRA